MSSRNHSEEQHSAQLQLVLRTLSTSGAAWEQLYSTFLYNAFRHEFGFNLFSNVRPGPDYFIPPNLGRLELPPPKPRLPEPSNRCILCFDDVALESDTAVPCGITCHRNHVIHRQCLDSLIVNHCETVLHTPSTPSHIHCPACTACRNTQIMFLPFHKSEYVQVETYSDNQLRHACGGASQQALDLLAAVAQADRNLAALPEDEQITNGNTDCYLCPQCKFGPVAHQACADLRAHHAHGGVSNKCPKCGFLGSSISEWIEISAPRPSAIAHIFAFHEFGFPDHDLHHLGRLVELRNLLAHTRNPWAHVNYWAHERFFEREVPTHIPSPVSFEPLNDFGREVRDRSLEASYWDAALRRLTQTAMLAAAGSNPRGAVMDNVSEAAGAENAAADSDSTRQQKQLECCRVV